MAYDALTQALLDAENACSRARALLRQRDAAAAAITELEAALAERDRRIAELEIHRSESRQLLRRLVTYVKEDRATTPGTTRLARLTDQAADYLARTGEPPDA